MVIRLAGWVTAAGALLLAGCIHHEETVYRDVARTSIQFENDKAARLFYEALNEPHANRTESQTRVHLPIVFDNERKVVSGPNEAFNRAVDICDANHDGRITELEARIFAESRNR
ncbi:MAG: hypothetical protein AB9869_04520 [Verrucomicrobiia bacterium]